jgi:hypothetical protein
MGVVLSLISSERPDRGIRISRQNSHHSHQTTPRATLTTVNQLGDYQVKTPSPATDNGRPDKRTIAIAVIVLLVLALGAYWFLGGEDTPAETAVGAPAPAPTPPPAAASPPANEPNPEPVELPGLNQSDGLVRELVATLSAHPDLASWLVSDGMIRRFVVVVDSVANGANPWQQVPFMRPAARFATTDSDETLAVDPRSHRRYTGHAQIIDSLDRQGTADIYRTLEPLMDEAYRELGYPDRRFRQSLELAVSHLLATPIVDRAPEVIEYPPFYRYRDPELEGLSAAQKQFLGMGPENVSVVQRVVGSIAQAIGLQVP